MQLKNDFFFHFLIVLLGAPCMRRCVCAAYTCAAYICAADICAADICAANICAARLLPTPQTFAPLGDLIFCIKIDFFVFFKNFTYFCLKCANFYILLYVNFSLILSLKLTIFSTIIKSHFFLKS